MTNSKLPNITSQLHAVTGGSTRWVPGSRPIPYFPRPKPVNPFPFINHWLGQPLPRASGR